MVPTGANYFIMKLMHPPTSLSVIAMAALLLLLYPSCMTSSTTPSMTMTAMAFTTPAVRIETINPTHSQHLPLSPSPRCIGSSTYHPRSASSSLSFAASVSVASCRRLYPHSPYRWARHMSEQPPDDEGADLAAQFFKALSERNISLDKDELDEDEEEDDDEDYYDDDETNSGEGDDADDAILREYDVPTTEEGMMELTDTQIYDDLKDRVLESAGAFVELASVSMVGVGDDDDDYDDEDDDGALVMAGGRGENLGIDAEGGGDGMYRPPTIVPDSGLTAGEVVELGELSVCV
jgi:hypothetical protein